VAHVPHQSRLVSVDSFTVPTVRLRVLFVFVVLAHDRLRLLHFNVTEQSDPCAAQTAVPLLCYGQSREACSPIEPVQVLLPYPSRTAD
jgi:hypothetical protein